MTLKKNILLLITGIVFIVGFFSLPRNRVWLTSKVFAYYHDFKRQKNKLDIEKRKTERYGNSYLFSMKIARYFSESGRLSSALVLIPPAAYFQKKGIDYEVPEPAVFYYYTGLKTIWAKSPLAKTANWYVHVADNKIMIDRVINPNVFQDSINAFNKYPSPL